MKPMLSALYARRDMAVVITCAIGMAFVLFVLPELEDQQPTVVAQAAADHQINQESR